MHPAALCGPARHSYGKTPLFYATTRCRDEVVRLLLEHGAKTRVLNNKGQSVLSLASSHLRPAAVEARARRRLVSPYICLHL